MMCINTGNPLAAAAACRGGVGVGGGHAMWRRDYNSKVEQGENILITCWCHVAYIVHVCECVRIVAKVYTIIYIKDTEIIADYSWHKLN